MRIIEGMSYRTRAGEMVGPVIWSDYNNAWRVDGRMWRPDGSWHVGGPHPNDLVPDQPPANDENQQWTPEEMAAFKRECSTPAEIHRLTPTARPLGRIAAYWTAHTGANITAADVETMFKLADLAAEPRP